MWMSRCVEVVGGSEVGSERRLSGEGSQRGDSGSGSSAFYRDDLFITKTCLLGLFVVNMSCFPMFPDGFQRKSMDKSKGFSTG